MRYTVATGEPVVTGFMRTRPGKTFWAWFYALVYFLQIGWPAWAATAAGAIFFLFAGRLAAPPADATNIYLIGIVTFLACVSVLLIGKRIARTLEILNWALVACILGSFLVLGILYVPGGTWLSALAGFAGFDTARDAFNFLPEHLDILLLGALVGYSGGGGVLNLTLSNWARDKGYGMGSRVGHIAGAVGGEKVHLADTGFMFDARRRQSGAVARLVAHRARRSVGHLLRRCLVRHDVARAAVRHVRCGRNRHQGSRHQRRAGADASAPPPAPGSESALHCSAYGSCSRRSSTASKA